MAIPSTDVALVGDGTTPGLLDEANGGHHQHRGLELV
jgi:hypothetical protein